MQTCAIIGAGLSGTTLISHLVKLTKEYYSSYSFSLKVFLIEKQTFGQGVAYSTACPEHLLNIPAQFMSAFHDDPDHFIQWAQKQNPSILPDSFVPRMMYSQYLSSLLKEAEAQQDLRCSFEKISGEVISLTRKAGKYLLQFKNGDSLSSDLVVLAMGNYPPPHLPLEDCSFIKSRRYIRNPWAAPKTFPSRAKILIVGTGLTMVDKVLELHAKNHLGEIHALSRHGFLPREYNPILTRILNENETQAELEESVSPTSFKVTSWLKHLRSELRKSAKEDIERVILQFMKPWKKWTAFPQKEFNCALRHLLKYYNAFAHPIPQQSAATLQKLIKEQKLFIHAGYLVNIKENGQLNVMFRPRGTESYESINADYVLNCLSPAKCPSDVEDPFLFDLFSKGFIRTTSHHLILDTVSKFDVINRKGEKMEGLFAIGSVKKSLFGSTTNARAIALQAKLLAHQIIRNCIV